jgi:hypothetical protein
LNPGHIIYILYGKAAHKSDELSRFRSDVINGYEVAVAFWVRSDPETDSNFGRTMTIWWPGNLCRSVHTGSRSCREQRPDSVIMFDRMLPLIYNMFSPLTRFLNFLSGRDDDKFSQAKLKDVYCHQTRFSDIFPETEMHFLR